MPNRLANEPSPYLRQHALNPVDWFPWGDEALLRARSENLPIFLSIGYSACHWCHVMAHESSRTKRSQRSSTPASSASRLTDRNGPTSTAFTWQQYRRSQAAADGRCPCSSRLRRTFLRRHVLPADSATRVALVHPSAPRCGRCLAGSQARDHHSWPASGFCNSRTEWTYCWGDRQRDRVRHTPPSLREAQRLLRLEAWRLGQSTEVPQPMVLEFLLRYHRLTQDSTALDLVTRTLDTMARSALYDQLGGGFHRYCVNQDWSVPHFEKMLYDNAQLARVYLHAWQITGEELYRSVVEETLDCAVREMTDPRGGFFSAQDADSEGEEGKFFVWSLDEVKRLLDPDATRFAAAYSLTQEGNFEGRNTMRFLGPLADRRTFSAARRRLLEARENRIRRRATGRS